MAFEYPKMYEVWWTVGDGMHRGPRFRYRSDAERYIDERLYHASFAIRDPEGEWCAWKPRRHVHAVYR